MEEGYPKAVIHAEMQWADSSVTGYLGLSIN